MYPPRRHDRRRAVPPGIELWQKRPIRGREQCHRARLRLSSSPIWMMIRSGARLQQIRQLAGIRGLMADPTGRIINACRSWPTSQGPDRCSSTSFQPTGRAKVSQTPRSAHRLQAARRIAPSSCGRRTAAPKEGTYLMELLGQIIWELVEYFGEMIWQTMATIPIVAVLLIVGIVIELLFGKRIRKRRPTDWKPTDTQNWDY